jgi:hypothetical protein
VAPCRQRQLRLAQEVSDLHGNQAHAESPTVQRPAFAHGQRVLHGPSRGVGEFVVRAQHGREGEGARNAGGPVVVVAAEHAAAGREAGVRFGRGAVEGAHAVVADGRARDGARELQPGLGGGGITVGGAVAHAERSITRRSSRHVPPHRRDEAVEATGAAAPHRHPRRARRTPPARSSGRRRGRERSRRRRRWWRWPHARAREVRSDLVQQRLDQRRRGGARRPIEHGGVASPRGVGAGEELRVPAPVERRGSGQSACDGEFGARRDGEVDPLGSSAAAARHGEDHRCQKPFEAPVLRSITLRAAPAARGASGSWGAASPIAIAASQPSGERARSRRRFPGGERPSWAEELRQGGGGGELDVCRVLARRHLRQLVVPVSTEVARQLLRCVEHG